MGFWWENLANAIIEQAAVDYVTAPDEAHWPFAEKKKGWTSRENKDFVKYIPPFQMEYNEQNVQKEVESFFNSKWFATLTELDGAEMLSRLNMIKARGAKIPAMAA